MKETQIKEKLKKLSVHELQEKLDQLRRALFTLRLNASTAHVKDYSQFKKLRKDIARMLTLMQSKQQQTVQQ